MAKVKYIVVLQCHIVKQRCSGYFCEESFCKREGGFSDYPVDEPIRYLNMTCGGCCGRATLRKLSNLLKNLKKSGEINSDEVVLHFSSCICKENFHGPKCPHYDYLKELVGRKNIAYREGTRISDKAESRRDNNGNWCQNK